MKYKIVIQDLQFDTIIGLLENERVEKQIVVIDCEIKYKKKDDLFVDYASVVEIIKNMLRDNKYLLIEDALEDIVCKLKQQFKQISSIKLKISKPQIVKNCTVGVEIFKKY